MNVTQIGAAPEAARRAQAEAALAEYPHLSEDRLTALIAWFRKEASALDVALVASNAAIAEPYARFRAEHIDTLGGKDIARGVTVAALVVAVIAALVWWAG